MAKAKTAKAAKPKKDAVPTRSDDIERVRISKEVPSAMNTEEAVRQAHALASTTIKIKAIQDKIAEFASKHRKDLRELRKEEQRLATAVDTGKVMRAISCFQVRDYRTNTVRYEDENGEKVAPDEVMPAEMRQKTIFDAAPEGERVEDDEIEDGEE